MNNLVNKIVWKMRIFRIDFLLRNKALLKAVASRMTKQSSASAEP